MKTTETLIRAQRWQVDELRRRLTDLETMRQSMMDTMRRLGESVEAEKSRVQDSAIGHFAFPGFASSIRERQSNLQTSIQDIEGKIDGIRDELNEAFRELKKIEQVETERDRRERAEAMRSAQAALDDQATIAHARAAAGE